MKNTIKRITALALAAMTLCTGVSCSNEKTELSETSTRVTADGKTIITIGMPGLNTLAMPYVVGFNDYCRKNMLNYEIEIVDYSKMVDDDDEYATKAVNKLKMEMATDNTPDIVVLHPMYMAELLQKGVFEDMYSLMESYDGANPEDFMPNVLEGLEYDGEIPAVPYSFFIRTAVAKTEFVGEDAENWSVEQAIEAYEKYSGEMQFVGTQSEEDFLADYILKKASKNCVDLENYTCNFSNPEFLSLLEFLRDNPKQSAYAPDFDAMTEQEVDAFFRDRELEFINDTSLIKPVTIDNLGQALGNEIYTYFGGEDVTFVGYPSEDGIGAVTYTNWLFGISRESKNKEGAWEFINYLLSEDVQTELYETGGIPVIKKYLDEQYNNKDTEDHRSIYYELYARGDYNARLYITEKAVQQYYDYILSAKFEPYSDERIEAMIDEECAAAIAGEKSPEEVARILDSRISIYLSEKS